jgi:sec-independent protein translocase protein TatC
MLVHLLELRRRVLYTLIWFGVLFLLFFFLAADLFHFLVSPLMNVLPNQEGLIATQVTAPVFIPLKLAADAALLFSAPFGLYHSWCFISPGLHKQEKEPVGKAIILSILLFILGVLFCFYVVLPFMFQFFYQAMPKGVQLLPDMAYAIDFITRMLLLFGFCFQVPLICLVMIRVNLIDLPTLKKMRPYVVVGAFTLGMILTPPDVFSQIMLALPLCLLYELGIILSSVSLKL